MCVYIYITIESNLEHPLEHGPPSRVGLTLEENLSSLPPKPLPAQSPQLGMWLVSSMLEF